MSVLSLSVLLRPTTRRLVPHSLSVLIKTQRLFSQTFQPTNAVILSKLTRFEYERIRNHELDDDELKTLVCHILIKLH